MTTKLDLTRVPAIAVYVCLGAGVVIWANVIVPVPEQPSISIEAVPLPSAV